MIIDRVQMVDPEEADAVEKELTEIVNDWVARARETKDLVYTAYNDPSKSLLIDASNETSAREMCFPTLWSLREVDRESNLYLINLRERTE